MRSMRRTGGTGAVVPLLVLCVVVGLVAVGFAQGFWLGNLHNGLLAFAFTFVGVAVLFQRPGHREGLLFLVVGVLEAVMFFGRQIGHFPSTTHDQWWGWLGVWPLALTLGAVTWCVLCFPEGRFLSPAWRRVGLAVAVVAVACSLVSALWPVEYDAAGVLTAHPLSLAGADATHAVWRASPIRSTSSSSSSGWSRWRPGGASPTASCAGSSWSCSSPSRCRRVGLVVGLAVSGSPAPESSWRR